MNAHQLCAIKALPKSLIRGYLLMLASGVHERNSAPAPDMREPFERRCESFQHPKGGMLTSDNSDSGVCQ